ncbi:hypothetical protein CRUP_024059, partial [Coryphaenoides rupestris]
TGQCYVAVGTERFRKLPYVELWLSKIMKPATGPEDRFSDSALLDSPLADGRRVKSSGDEATEVGAPQANQRSGIAEGGRRQEESSIFPPSRPVRVHRNRGYPRIPARNGPEQPSSLFNKKAVRRRREEVRGAQEVQDDENTHTELPVDQRVAEVVEDEEEESREEDVVHPQNTEKKHPELSRSGGNHLQEAQRHNGSQADLGSEQAAVISRVSSSASLGSRGRPDQSKNGGVEGAGSSPQSPRSPKAPLPRSPADMTEESKGPVMENGGPTNQITT